MARVKCAPSGPFGRIWAMKKGQGVSAISSLSFHLGDGTMGGWRDGRLAQGHNDSREMT